MQFTDNAIVLDIQRHGENSRILSFFSLEHGRSAGLVRGSGKTSQGLYQPGNIIRVTWQARLPDHLGTVTAELLHPTAAQYMDRAASLLALHAACSWCRLALPDRSPYARLYHNMLALFDGLRHGNWAAHYVVWELSLLQHLGFGLDLSECALTGGRDGLAYVSPKTGRAVEREAGRPWADKLLRLPDFIAHLAANEAEISPANEDMPPHEILSGLELSGFFLDRHILQPKRKSWPTPRMLLIRKLLMLQEQEQGANPSALAI